MVKRPPLPALTSLRFFAASGVVAFHAVVGALGEAVPVEGVARNLALGGQTAVTFFFILSGFILTYAHAGRSEVDRLDIRPTTFWRLRAARIVPAYFLGLVIAVPFLVAFLASPGPLWEKVAGPVLVILFLQAWWPPLSLIWNYPAWSLSVEAAFYALFPRLSSSFAQMRRRWLFMMAYGLILVTTVCTSVPAIATDTLTTHFPITIFHLPLFIFGMALGRQFTFGRTLSPAIHGVIFCLGTGGNHEA